MQDIVLLVIFFHPHKPAIQAHNGIIKINGGFPQQVGLETDIYIYNRIDESNRVNQYIFFPAKPHAGNTGKDGYKFIPGRVLQACDELLVYFRKRQRFDFFKCN